MLNYNFSNKYSADKNGNVYVEIPHPKNNLVKAGGKMKHFINKYGYVEFNLRNRTNQRKHIQAHRIVASLFIDNPENKKYVNHIDGNKLNNNISNLEWCTASENEKHSYQILGKKVWNKGLSLPNGKNYRGKIRPVNKYDLEMNFEKEYFNPTEAEEDGYSLKQISAVCTGRQKTHKNKIWRYINES